MKSCIGLYICYDIDHEGNENTIKSEEEWKNEFDKHGDKENFSDRDSWFTEMMLMQVLVPVND